jgi:UDP-glucose 4-epimerase
MLTNNILVIGGAGYIGSHMVLALQARGMRPIVLDNLSTGHRDAVLGAECIVGDIADKELLKQIFATHNISAVMHFASFIEVAESVKNPAKYYQNNVAKLLTLLDVMVECDIKQFIFSSSAAVYGEPQYNPINEAHPLAPINPYGRSKRMAEEIIADYAASHALQYAILRYFNAAGADPEGRAGERHKHESHLIPLILAVARGERECITVYGNDYLTPDGTCVRDYVHVTDLCDAHLLTLQALQQGKKQLIYNVGNGQGFSVQKVIAVARVVTGFDIPVVFTQRRVGDPAILIADASLIKQELSWRPQFGDLPQIITHAWNYHGIPESIFV